VLDYSCEVGETGMNLGDDLNEGKLTLPLLHVLHRGSSAQATLVRRAVEGGGRDDFAAVLDAIRSTGALDRARSAARAEAQAACAAISGLCDSNYRRSLLDLATFAVERSY